MIKFKQKLTTFLRFYRFKKDMLLVSFCTGFNKNGMRKVEDREAKETKAGETNAGVPCCEPSWYWKFKET